MATAETLSIMGVRYGAQFTQSQQAAHLGEPLRLGDVIVTFYAAGHVLGSAQIAIEAGGYRLVVSGDYKRGRDPTCAPFRPVRCHAFVTEATFGLPIFRHPEAATEVMRLLASRDLFPERTHILGVYALGKAQRMMALLREAGYDRPIYIHGALERLTAFYEEAGLALGAVRKVSAAERPNLGGEIVMCPPGAIKELWARKFPEPVTAAASGWMRVRALARQKGVELPLIVSDHADWDGLCQTVIDTGCEELWVTHGEADALVHWATGRGLSARPLHLIGYGEDEGAEDAPASDGAQAMNADVA